MSSRGSRRGGRCGDGVTLTTGLPVGELKLIMLGDDEREFSAVDWVAAQVEELPPWRAAILRVLQQDEDAA